MIVGLPVYCNAAELTSINAHGLLSFRPKAIFRALQIRTRQY